MSMACMVLVVRLRLVPVDEEELEHGVVVLLRLDEDEDALDLDLVADEDVLFFLPPFTQSRPRRSSLTSPTVPCTIILPSLTTP